MRFSAQRGRSATSSLMPSLARLLREHKLAVTHRADDPVFATLTGAPMYYRNVTRCGLAAALAKAEPNGEGELPLGFHDLRYTYALCCQPPSRPCLAVGHTSRLQRPIRSRRTRTAGS